LRVGFGGCRQHIQSDALFVHAIYEFDKLTLSR